MTAPAGAPKPSDKPLGETTTKANAALGGGAVGGTLGAAIATMISYAIWKGTAPPGLEAAIAVMVTAVLSAVGAWIATYYAPPNRPQPPPPGP